MSASLHTAPKAEVFEVEDLVRKVWEGQVRIPDFQRPLRWGREDARRLFESILRGYPIGNLLLWAKPAPSGLVRLGALSIDAPAYERALWVVDGQQRVTTLANALSHDGAHDDRFGLSVDLETQDVVRSQSAAAASVIPLPVLFDLQTLLRWFRDHPEVGAYFDVATGVAKRIRQAQVSASVVDTQDERVLRDIFDRINNYGKRLTRAEVFSALHSSTSADSSASGPIEAIAQQIADGDDFGLIDSDTVLRAVLARRGPDITREIRLEFDDQRRVSSDFPGESVQTAYAEAAIALTHAVHFLQRDCDVPHFALLPYRHLLIVLTRVFAHHALENPRERQLLRRWLWRAASAGPGVVPGSTTGTARAFCTKVDPADIGTTLTALLEAVPQVMLRIPDVSKFRTNHAQSKIVTCAMWEKGPRSLTDGHTIERRELAESLGDSQTPREALTAVVPRGTSAEGETDTAARWLMLPGVELRPREIVELLAVGSSSIETVWPDVLKSHVISPTAAYAFTAKNWADFTEERQQEIQTVVKEFLESRWELGFENSVSLDSFLIDDDEDLDLDGFDVAGQ